MLEQLKEAYRKIDLEDKRNELNKELLSLLMLIDTKTNLYNYEKNNGISEDEYLTETYIQVMELRNGIIDMLRKR